MTIKDDVNLDPIGKTAICLLLDDHKSAKFYYKQASQEERSFLTLSLYTDSGIQLNNSHGTPEDADGGYGR